MHDEQDTSNKETERAGASEELLHGLINELDQLVQRLQAMTPRYVPPAFAPRRFLAQVEEVIKRFFPDLQSGVLKRLQECIGGDLLELETWQGIWYLINYSLKLQGDIIKRRFTGEYETDEWGLDWELLESVIPLFNFLYEAYWRVETSGVENIPFDGRTLLVSNHSGQLPWDGAMIAAAVWNEHPTQRLVRSLYTPWFSTLPFISAALMKMGQAPATVENGTRLLEKENLVATFPEGHQGAGKPLWDRYKLTSFGRGEFVKMALNASAPIIPVAVVGAEETHLSLGNSPALARLTGLPRFPITSTFPWLGPMGLIPLPTKWYIDFGEPIPMEDYGPDAATDLLLIKKLTERTRDTVQEMIQARLEQRRSVFLG
jgi:1-acyl-sn-glycerol-3-phosphate acyltransferase